MFAKQQMQQLIRKVSSPEALIRENASLRHRLDAERSSIMFLVSLAFNSLFKERLETVYMTDVVAYCVGKSGKVLSSEEFSNLTLKIQQIFTDHSKINLVNVERLSLINYFKSIHQNDTVSVLENETIDEFTCSYLDNCDYLNVCFTPIETNMSKLSNYSMQQFDNGIILTFPSLLNPTFPSKFDPSNTNYHNMLVKFSKWSHSTNTSDISCLNQSIYGLSELNKECLDFSRTQLKLISKSLIDNFPQKRLITIAGPSSSGKSTFSRLIKNSLLEYGYETLIVSMDDFYKMRTNIPFGSDGLKDFECLEAFDVELLAERLQKLLQGESVPEHHYSFVTGLNWDEERTLQLSSKSFLILEGIHGLNPQFLEYLGKNLTKIYVCPMTPLLIDAEHCYSPSELRLLRRIIRDDRSRGYPARATLRQWTSVRIGEERNITPNIGNADIYFNSSLAYELPVLSGLATKLLRDAERIDADENQDDERVIEVTNEARQIETSLSLFKKLTMMDVPKDSCLHEFI